MSKKTDSSTRTKLLPIMSKQASRHLPGWLLAIYFAFLGAGFATMLRVGWLYVRPPVFETRSKLVAGVRMGGSVTAHPQFQEMLDSMLNTVMESIQSPEMTRRAADRVRSLHPEALPCDVNIRTYRTNNSQIVNLIITGPKPKYIQHYLNALMDEFMTVRASWREASANKIYSPYLQAVVDAQRKVEEALEALEVAKREVESVSAKVELERLSQRLERLRDERDDQRQSKGEKKPATEVEIQRIEAELAKHEVAASRLRKATELYELHKRAYQELFEQAEQWLNLDQVVDYVHIQERATVASQQPVLSWSSIGYFFPGLGCLIGAITGLGYVRRRPLESLG